MMLFILRHRTSSFSDLHRHYFEVTLYRRTMVPHGDAITRRILSNRFVVANHGHQPHMFDVGGMKLSDAILYSFHDYKEWSFCSVMPNKMLWARYPVVKLMNANLLHHPLHIITHRAY
jgi:hypothetical protein